MSYNNYGMGFTVSAKDEASPALSNVADKLGKTSDASKKAKVSFEDIGGEMKDAGQKMTVAGLAGAAALGVAANAAAKFEFGVAQVATEADKAKLPMDAINDIAKKMALTYGGDLDTQVKALYQGVAAGADTAAKATQLLDGANRLAIAGNTDQATAILGITKVLNNYGMTFDHATDVADAFFVAVKNGQTTVGELGDAIGQVAALGKNAGLSMEELIGALGTAATLGKDTAGSAASLKAVLSGIAHPTKDATDEAKKLGIQFDSVTLRSKGLVGFLKDITSSANYNADSFNKLFGSMEAAGFMQALVANDMSALSGMMDGMKNKAGGAQAAFELMSQTMQQQASILKANVEVALVDLGQALMPFIKEMMGLVQKAVQAFTSLPASVKKAIAIGFALASVLLIVVGVLTTVIGGILALTAVSEAAIIAGIAVVALFAEMVVILGVLAAAFYIFKKAYEDNLGGFKDLVDNVYKKVKLAWDALTQVFSDGQFSGAVLEELKKTENQGIKDFAIQAFLWFNRIKNFFTGLTTGFEQGFQSLRPIFTRFTAAIQDIGKALGFAKDGPEEAGKAFDKFGKTGEQVGNTIAQVAGFVVETMTGIAKAVRAAIDVFQFLRKSSQPLAPAFASLMDSFGRVAEALGLTTKAGGGTSDMWKTLGAVIGFIVGQIVSQIATFINVVATIMAVVAPIITGVIQIFQGLWNFFGGFIDFFVGVLTGNWGMALGGMKQMAFGFVQFVVGIFNTLAGSVFAIVDKILQAFGKTSNLAGDLQKEGQSILNSTQQGLGIQNIAGGQDRRALPVVGDANPAAGVTGANAKANAANADKSGQPINANIKTELHVDGQKMAEVTNKANLSNNQREGGPNPAPT